MRLLVWLIVLLWSVSASAGMGLGVTHGRVVVSASSGISDDFSTDTSANYTALEGTVNVASGQLTCSVWTVMSAYYNVSTTGSNDNYAKADVSVGNIADESGVLFRWNATNSTGYEAVVKPSSGVKVYSVSGTTRTLVSAYSTTYSVDTVYTLKAQITGTTLSVWVNGSPVTLNVPTDDTYSTGASAGVVVYRGNGGGGYVDNFGADSL